MWCFCCTCCVLLSECETQRAVKHCYHSTCVLIQCITAVHFLSVLLKHISGVYFLSVLLRRITRKYYRSVFLECRLSRVIRTGVTFGLLGGASLFTEIVSIRRVFWGYLWGAIIMEACQGQESNDGAVSISCFSSLYLNEIAWDSISSSFCLPSVMSLQLTEGRVLVE